MKNDALLRRTAIRAVTAAVLSFVAVARALPPPRDDRGTCLVCHDDAELESSDGTPVHVDPALFAASIHGRSGIGCVGCHAGLKGVEDFPHRRDLEPVTCAGCHGDYGRSSLGGIHGMTTHRLAAEPVLCKDCHGYHDVLPSSDAGSAIHPSRRPATCAKCHPGAGENYSRGRVHELAATARTSPAGVVRILYKILIGGLAAFFLVYIAADLARWRRER